MLMYPEGIVRVTNKTVDLYDDFIDKVVHEDSVFRFYSGSPYKISNSDTPSSADFDGITFIDVNANSLMSVTFRRGNNNHCASLCLYALPCPEKSKLVAKLLWCLPKIMSGYGISYLDTCVHSTNDKSLRLLSNIIPSWGTEPKGLYDSLFGIFVDSVHFRFSSSDICTYLSKHSRLSRKILMTT